MSWLSTMNGNKNSGNGWTGSEKQMHWVSQLKSR